MAKRNPAITPQQKRAIELFKQNMLTNGTRSYEEILIQAGYSKESARQQSNVMAGIKPHLAEFIDEMKEHRDVVIERMKTQVNSADYSSLVRAVDVLSRNIQLLGGKPTHNVLLTDERRAELDGLIDEDD
jgi:hypothetical protein